MTKEFDLVVYIGRFQPFHNAHYDIAKKALEISHRLLFVVGSAYQPATFKNPFNNNFKQVTHWDLFQDLCSDEDYDRWDIKYVRDYVDDEPWLADVQKLVSEYEVFDKIDNPIKNPRIGLIGCDKDETSYYLKMFPQWKTIIMPREQNLSSTDIRNLYFVEEPNMDFIKNVVPPAVYSILDNQKNSEWHNHIVNERRAMEKYRSAFSALPYAPTFVTTDAVVVQSGHVLLTRRGAYPGKGLIALPGGFLNAATDKSLVNCMIRELREETGLKIPEKVLKGSIKDSHVFDAIDRSSRGRTITHAYYIPLSEPGELPRVKGGDDAEKAFWMPLSEVKSEEMFEDHYQIIKHFTKL